MAVLKNRLGDGQWQFMASMEETPALGMPLKQDHAPQEGDAQRKMAVVIGSGVSQVSALADP